MEFVVYDDFENGLTVGMLKEEFLKMKEVHGFLGLDYPKLESWEDFKKYLVLKYGRVNTVIRKGDKFEHLYDVKPDKVAEGTIQIPIWKINGQWAIPVCEGSFLMFKTVDGQPASDEVIQTMIYEALKKNRFGEITDVIIKDRGSRDD